MTQSVQEYDVYIIVDSGFNCRTTKQISEYIKINLTLFGNKNIHLMFSLSSKKIQLVSYIKILNQDSKQATFSYT